MKNPVTKLRISQFKNLFQKLKQFQNPITQDEETLLIKYFEITYELIIKTLSSLYLSEVNFPSPTKKSLFIWTFKYKLINNVEKWIDINNLRNETVHEYLGPDIFSFVPKIILFLPEIKYFIEKLTFLHEQQNKS